MFSNMERIFRFPQHPFRFRSCVSRSVLFSAGELLPENKLKVKASFFYLKNHCLYKRAVYYSRENERTERRLF